MKLRPSSDDRSHDSTTSLLQDAFNHFTNGFQHSLDALSHFASLRDNYYKSIKVNPIGQQFVKICYHGPNPVAVFTVTLKDTGEWDKLECIHIHGSYHASFALL